MGLRTSLNIFLVLSLLLLDVSVLLLHFCDLKSLFLFVFFLLFCLVTQLLLVFLSLFSLSHHSLVLFFVGILDLVLEHLACNLAVRKHFLLLFLPLCVGWIESVELLLKNVVKEVLVLSLDLIHGFLLLSNLPHLLLLQSSIFSFPLLLDLLLFLVEFSEVLLH